MFTDVPKPKMNFRDFLTTRRDICGMENWEALAKEASISEATLYRIAADDPERPETSITSRNRVARALRFQDWWALRWAWLNNRVDQKLDKIFSPHARSDEELGLFEQIETIAKEVGVDPVLASKLISRWNELINERITENKPRRAK